MIIPSIGEVPNWIIAYASVAAVVLVFIIRRFMSLRVRNAELYLDAAAVDIKNFFVWISDKIKKIQVDTINTDMTIMGIGIVMILIIYIIVVVVW